MTINRVSISQQIRERLLEYIACGRLQPGDRVIEAEVAAEMHVSSIPVREAIRELVAMGMLQSAPHRGAWVRQVSLVETIQAFHIRSVLEPLAVESAAPGLRQQCPELRRVVKRIVDAAKKRDFASYQHHNQLFHRAIVAASGNQVLLRVWDSLAFEVRTRFTMDYLTTVDPVAIAREHELIVTALDGGDAPKAASLLRSHSTELMDYLSAQTAHESDSSATPKKHSGRGRRGSAGNGKARE
jgi:DNA-binding GntR family transcriptional regulator